MERRQQNNTEPYQQAKLVLRDRLLEGDGLFDVAHTTLGLRTNMTKVITARAFPFEMRLRDGMMTYHVPEEEAREAFASLSPAQQSIIARQLLMRSAHRLDAMNIISADFFQQQRIQARRNAALLAIDRFASPKADAGGG